VKYAQGERVLNATTAKKYMDELEKIQGNIREMLLRQAAVAKGCTFESGYTNGVLMFSRSHSTLTSLRSL
jgi:hypothetical protein